MHAFKQFEDGSPGSFQTEYKDTRYTLVSSDNNLRNGPRVRLLVQHLSSRTWVTIMEVDGVTSIYNTDALIVVCSFATIRIAYDTLKEGDGEYVVPPLSPAPFPQVPSNEGLSVSRLDLPPVSGGSVSSVPE